MKKKQFGIFADDEVDFWILTLKRYLHPFVYHPKGIKNGLGTGFWVNRDNHHSLKIYYRTPSPLSADLGRANWRLSETTSRASWRCRYFWTYLGS
jgi:hypothetical protein